MPAFLGPLESRSSSADLGESVPSCRHSVRRVGGLALCKSLLERLVAEHRALEARRADVDPEQLQQVVGAERLDVGDGLALDLVRQQRCRCLADGTAATCEPDALDDTLVDPELE